MKRFIAMLLSVVMILSLMPTVAFAATKSIALKVDTTECATAKAGDTVSVPVYITENPGVNMIIADVIYETEIFDLVSIEGSAEFKGEGAYDINGAKFSWETDGEDNALENVLLFTVNLTVKDGVADGDTTITIDEKTIDCADGDFESFGGTVVPGTIKIEYETTGLTFDNGSQEPMSFAEAKAEALGTGSLTKPDSTNTYYFAGWFSGLSDTYKDANGFYVIDTTATLTGIAGTELRPRYDTPPTEGTYNALWVKGDGTGKYMMVMGANSFDLYYNTEHTVAADGADDGLLAVINAANGARIKLLHDITWSYTKGVSAYTTAAMYLDLNGCTVNQTKGFRSLNAGSSVESSRAGGAIIATSGSQANLSSGSNDMGTVRDITITGKGTLAFANVTLRNCVITIAGTALNTMGNSTIDGCTFTDCTGYLVKAVDADSITTITNSVLETSGTKGVFLGYSDPDISAGGTIVFGEGVTITAPNATTLTNTFKEVRFNAIDGEYTIAASAAVPFTGAEIITIPDGKGCGLVDGVLAFGSTYTVTYKTFDGQSVIGTLSVLEGSAADLISKSSTYADAKYKHGGWSLTMGGEALTSYTVNSDITLYAVRAEAGPRDEHGNELTGDVTWGLGYDETTATITNANKLGELNSLIIDNQISNTHTSYNYLTFSAAALDSIASLVTGNEVDITLNRINGTESDGYVTKFELNVKENGNKVDFTGPVTVRFRFDGDSSKTYRIYHVNGEEATGIATTVNHAYAYSEVEFTTNHFSTFELREVELANGYTAGLSVTEDEVRAGGNTVNVTVDMTHQDTTAGANDTQFNAAEIVVAYDPALLTPVTTGLTAGTYKVDPTNGKLTIEVYGAAQDLGAGVFNLQFTTCASVDADTVATVTLESAAFADSVDAQSEDLIPATIDPASDTVNILLEAFAVTKDDATVTGANEAVKGEDYEFSFAVDEHYNYTVQVTVSDSNVAVTPSATEPGKYTVAGNLVTGPITITVTPEAKQYNVTFSGDAPAESDGAKATHDTAYNFTLPTKAQWQYSYTITIAGATYTGASRNGNVVTIPGSAITGDIAINITCEQTEFNLTLNGEDATLKNEDGSDKYDKGDNAIVTITPAPGYTYTVSAVKTGTTDSVTVTDNGDNTYTIANIQNDLTITITKSVVGTVEVRQYIQVDGLSMMLVTYTGDLAEGYIPYYNDGAMYWSENYGAYCYLVVAETLTEEDATAAVSVKSGDKAAQTISYTYNVNGSTNTDAADAQLVYDMYNALYPNFDTVSMLKFLLADVNNSKNVDVEDAAAIIAEILK